MGIFFVAYPTLGKSGHGQGSAIIDGNPGANRVKYLAQGQTDRFHLVGLGIQTSNLSAAKALTTRLPAAHIRQGEYGIRWYAGANKWFQKGTNLG